ncbi:MAG: molybdate ABC transporter substrate-binding protein [Rhizobiaceae bacterium]|nr:molybdate ABC transporter substrate-binding protein [Rhizobiaceae bacterium]
MPFLRVLFITLAVFFGFQANEAASGERLIVYAAASMKEAVEEISRAYQSTCDCKIILSVGGTGMLARQVAQGAPADIFISADKKWIEYLVEKQAINGKSIQIIATNQLIIAVAKSYDGNEGALQLLGEKRFALADPLSVPAGRYAVEALKNLGEWGKIKSNAVQTENVRIALSMAARGDVSAAIVYASDLLVEPRVKEVFRFTPDLHSKIEYLAVLTNTAGNGASSFLDFLNSPKAQAILQKFGFSAVTDK